MIGNLLQDLRYAARSLRRTPALTAAAVITLALGIGANSTIFTLLDGVMFKPLALPDANELVTLYELPSEPGASSGTPDTSGGTGRYLRFSYPRFLRLQQSLGNKGSLAAMTRNGRFVFGRPNNPSRSTIRGQLVSGNYFATAGVSVSRGRPLNDDDIRNGPVQPVAVISDAMWKRLLGAADDAIGSTIVVGRTAVTIVGIAPPGFVGVWTDTEADIWMPLTMQQTLNYRNNVSSYGEVRRNDPWASQDNIAWLNLYGRISPSSRAEAEVALKTANRNGLTDLADIANDPSGRASIMANVLVVESFSRGFSGLRARYSTALVALAGMVGIVLLIACANIANLLLARSTARSRELGIRASLGASRWRLIQQGLMESLLIAASGGAAGYLAARWGSDLIARAVIGSVDTPIPSVFSPDLRQLIFTASIALGTVVLFGLLPTLRASQIDTGAVAQGRTITSGRTMRAMRPLVAGQLALAFVVVFAAALLGRTLINFSKINPGFSTDHIVTAAFNLIASGYAPDQYPALRDRLVRAARSAPGVTAAVVSTCGLLSDCSQSSGFRIGGQIGKQLNENYVGPGYFSTVGIPVKSGREFDERDGAKAPFVAVISESVAKQFFGTESAIGQQIGDKDFTAVIVGVVGDTRPRSLRDAPVPMVYLPIEQWNLPVYNLEARVASDPRAVVPAMRRAFAAAEPNVIVDTLSTMDANVARNLSRERLVTYLIGALGGLALLLGCIGLYGVLSYSVARQIPELGVRIALGATPADLRGIVFKNAITVIAGGTAAGVLAAVWANRLLQSLLFDVSTFDPLSGAVVVGLLAGCALAACSLPAVRAARIDPIQALRSE